MSNPNPERAEAREAIRQSLEDHAHVISPFDGHVVSYVVVMEVAMSQQRRGFVHLSSTPVGGEVPSWQQAGMLLKGAVRELTHGM